MTIEKLKQFLAAPSTLSRPYSPADKAKIMRLTVGSVIISAIAEGHNRRLSITTPDGYAGAYTIAHYRKAAGVPVGGKESQREVKRPAGGLWYVVSINWSVAPPPIQSGLFEGEQ